jgi:hypothetical protein
VALWGGAGWGGWGDLGVEAAEEVVGRGGVGRDHLRARASGAAPGIGASAATGAGPRPAAERGTGLGCSVRTCCPLAAMTQKLRH